MARWRRCELRRQELAEPLLARHRGRIVKVSGGAALVEFASVVDALRCAMAIQRGMERRNADLPSDRRIRYRIGVHFGEIVADEGAAAGDGVAVAARLQAQATPGGIVVSAAVRGQVGDKEGFHFVDLGERVLEIGGRPLHSFAVQLSSPSDRARTEAPRAASRPSIAVLPFENLTQDAGEDYFSAGVAEDLITELSKISGLFVAARPSSFAMRQTPQDAMATCARLKVSYVLDGSVRRAGDRVRITARLVDGATGGQVWAERYDRTLTDLFAVQDEIARSIAARWRSSCCVPSATPWLGRRPGISRRTISICAAWRCSVSGSGLPMSSRAGCSAALRSWTPTSPVRWPGSPSAIAGSTCIVACRSLRHRPGDGRAGGGPGAQSRQCACRARRGAAGDRATHGGYPRL